jgi:hypothetical protein
MPQQAFFKHRNTMPTRQCTIAVLLTHSSASTRAQPDVCPHTHHQLFLKNNNGTCSNPPQKKINTVCWRPKAPLYFTYCISSIKEGTTNKALPKSSTTNVLLQAPFIIMLWGQVEEHPEMLPAALDVQDVQSKWLAVAS